MNKLFIYYSNSGNGDYVASVLSSKGFDTIKIEPVKDLPNNYFLKLLVGGFGALIHDKAKLKNDMLSLANVLRSYNEIYVGTPIWNNRVSTPINSVLDLLKNKKFNLICYSSSGKAKGVIRQLKGYNIENIISLNEPLKNKEDIIKIINKYIQ